MSAKAICDMDCFNCKYEDCINDKLEFEDYVLSSYIDNDIILRRNGKIPRKMSEIAIKRKKEYKTENKQKEKAYAQAYYTLNRERFKKYRLENRERKSAYDRVYFERNRDDIIKKNKIYGLKNKERLHQRQKEWRSKNRDKIKEYQRQYYLRKKLENKTAD